MFALGIFWGGLSLYAPTLLMVDLFPGHSDITRFRPWSPIVTGNHLDRAEKNPEFAQTTGTVDVFDPRLGRPGRGATEVEKSSRLNCTTQFFTVAYECAPYPNVSVRMARISFGALPCREKKTL